MWRIIASLWMVVLLGGCYPAPVCCGRFGKIVDAETGEPLVGAEVTWAATSDEVLAGRSYSDYLAEFGRTIGFTTETGGIVVPFCGQSQPLDLVNLRFTTVNDLTLLGVADGERSCMVAVRTETFSEGQQLPRILEVESPGLEVSLSGWLCQSDPTVDDLIPPEEREGNSRVTLMLVLRSDDASPPNIDEVYWPSEPPGEVVSGVPVEFATMSAAELGDRSPDDYLDEFGRVIGRTDSDGQIDVQVHTVVPAYSQCGRGLVDDRWLVRVQVGEDHYTVEMQPEGAPETSRFFHFTSAVFQNPDHNLTVYTPYADCLNEHAPWLR